MKPLVFKNRDGKVGRYVNCKCPKGKCPPRAKR